MVALAKEFAPPRQNRAAKNALWGRVQVSGLRYYNPEMGRWLSRDPVGEWGGINVYLGFANRPIDQFDILGLSVDDDISRLCQAINSKEFQKCMGIRAGIVAGLRKMCEDQDKIPVFEIDDPSACPRDGNSVTCGFTCHKNDWPCKGKKRKRGIYICTNNEDKCPRACTLLHEMVHLQTRMAGEPGAYDTECCLAGCKESIPEEYKDKGNCKDPEPCAELPPPPYEPEYPEY